MTEPASAGEAREWGGRLGILLGSDRATERERYFIAEFLRGPLTPDRVLVVAVRSGKSFAFRWAERLANTLINATGRLKLDLRPIGDLVDSRVDAVAADADELPDLIRKARLDFLVDFRRENDASTLGPLVARGAFQVWCDGHPEDLTFGSVLWRRPRHLVLSITRAGSPTATVVADSHQIPASHVLGHDRRALAGRAIAFLLRALRSADLQDERAFESARTRLTPVTLLAGAFRALAHHGLSRIRRVVENEEAWFIATRSRVPRNPESPRLSANSFRVFDPFPGGFVADPCVLRHQGRDYVFYEEFRRADRRGVISCSIIDEVGRLTPPRRVLTESYHLSYPFVFKHRGLAYMVPESSANMTVDLYRAVDFPWRWQPAGRLLSGINAVDSTLYHDGTRWWLFANVGEHGSSTWDELFIFYSDTLVGPWRPHASNPVKADSSSSRPAGALWTEGGRLIRPAQDCSVRYGGGIALCHVELLTPSEFRETVIEHVPAEALPNCDGCHTIAMSAQVELIDARWQPGARRSKSGQMIRATR